MTLDQMIFTAVRIHTWDKPVFETVKRSIDIIQQCEMAIDAEKRVKEAEARGLTPAEILKEAMSKHGNATV